MDEILRKYIRYALNEKPFNPELVANLIQLRKASGLDYSQVAGILNEISRRIVQDKGSLSCHCSALYASRAVVYYFFFFAGIWFIFFIKETNLIGMVGRETHVLPYFHYVKCTCAKMKFTD